MNHVPTVDEFLDALAPRAFCGDYPPEPTNADRAGWATFALAAYAEQTRHGETAEYLDHPDGVEELAADLIGDLCHVLQQAGLAPGPILQRARDRFEEELAEETTNHTDEEEEEGR